MDSAHLFVSRARGDSFDVSDWDMVIVSGTFISMPFPERETLVLKQLPLRRVDLFVIPKSNSKKRLGR